MEVEEIGIDRIDVSRFNTRKDLQAGGEDAGLQDLAQSISRNGLLQPITVRPARNGRWELIAGQRRYLATKSLGLKTIPAIVRNDVTDTNVTSISLIENVHRADMAPLDKAQAFLRLVEELGSVQAVGKETGFGEQTIRKYLDLTRLPAALQSKLSTKEGPIGVDALSRLARDFPDEADAMAAYEQIQGFRAGVQAEILARSEGDLGRLEGFAAQAHEGLFNMRQCRDGFCFYMDATTKEAFRGAIISEHLSIRKLVDGLGLRPQ
jgi:ParB/RepB/Spo0J family partition protein